MQVVGQAVDTFTSSPLKSAWDDTPLAESV